jgi:EpsI family protein
VSVRVRAAVTLGLLLGLLLLLNIRSRGEAVPLRRPLEALPHAIGDWREQAAAPLDADVITLLKLNDYVMRRYVAGDGTNLWLYIGYWESQRKGAIIHSPRNCLPGNGWEPIDSSRLTIPMAAPRTALTVNRYLVQKDHLQQVVLYWYQARGRAMAGEIEARVELISSAMLQNRTDGALVRVSALVKGDAAATTARLTSYVQALVPALEEHLPR